MAKTSNFSVKGNGYESPRICLTHIDEDVVTASGTKLTMSGFDWGNFDDTRDNTFIGGGN